MLERPKQGAEKQEPRGNGAAVAPSISLPKGGGAIRGMGEKFAANPVTGTGSMSVPIATPTLTAIAFRVRDAHFAWRENTPAAATTSVP